MRRKLISLAMAALLLAVPAWGKKKKPEFHTIEITRFSKVQGVDLSANFLDYLYEALYNLWAGRGGERERKYQSWLFEQAIGENEVVSSSAVRQTLTLRGTILEYGKGSHAKSLIIGFGVGRRSLEAQVTLFRRMDNATVFEKLIKVRSQKTLDEKFLARFFAKELAEEIEKNAEQIHAALREADRRYVPPAVAAGPAQAAKPGQAGLPPGSASGGEQHEGKVTTGTRPSMPVAPPKKEVTPAPVEAAAPEPPEEPGIVLVSSTPEGGEVFVDEGFVGNTPARVKLSPGKHMVRVVMAGQEDWVRQLSVLPGSELKVAVVYTPKAPPPEPPAPAPNPKALSKQEILGLLTDYVPNARIAALVKEHGVKFTPTQADLNEIADAGGDNNLIEAIRQAAAPVAR